jgi:hypothetical protein
MDLNCIYFYIILPSYTISFTLRIWYNIDNVNLSFICNVNCSRPILSEMKMAQNLRNLTEIRHISSSSSSDRHDIPTMRSLNDLKHDAL